jgi:N-acetylneuraminate synthase
MFGPDVPASVTTVELKQLVEGVRFIEKMLANPSDKDQLADEAAPLRALFTKSVVARTDLPAGTLLQPNHLTVKKPGTGIPSAQLPNLLGRKLVRPVMADALLTFDDLEGG